MPLILFLCLLAACAVGYWRWSKHQTHQKILASTLSDQERSIILERVPVYQRIPLDLRAQLEGKINLFLDQVEFIGCDGLEVTEEMELSIAAQACLLVANKTIWYKNL